MEEKNITNRKGKEVTYKGKKYNSISELCRALNLPYSVVAHKYYRTNNIDEAVEWVKKTKERKELLSLWGKHYKSLAEVAFDFGLNLRSITSRLESITELENAVEELLNKETIIYEGKAYLGITELATAYGKDAGLVMSRVKTGFSLERALNQEIRQFNRPELEISYGGKIYRNKRELYREIGVTAALVSDFMRGYEVNFEVSVDIIVEAKRRIGIPLSQMISYIPICIIRGKHYKTEIQVANELGITSTALATYKSRYGYTGVLSALQAMQNETIEGYVINGERKTRRELCNMGYTSVNYKQVPKKKFLRYPQLEGIDLYTNCVDSKEIYEKVKEELLPARQEMQMNM